eukprot:TRINITY_DN18647_c0_g1_i1.p1 TRINITY_DN18647_c0_g1~~TRINITY_DN18647_c0_g1_i1.p1  ORF type:complete len:366 (+),score=68.77 TRINITY_DN18647_c0_g1_i1:46-1143(+)
MIRKAFQRGISRSRVLKINGEGVSKMSDIFKQREDMTLFLENIEYSNDIDGVLQVMKKLDGAVEKVTLTDDEGAALLEKQLSRIEVSLEDDDFDGARKNLQVARQIYRMLEAKHNANVKCISQIIKACCLCQETDLTDTYYTKAKEQNYTLDIECLNNLLNLTKYSAMGVGFLDVLESHNVKANNDTYTTMLVCARDSGDLQSGRLVFKKIQESGTRTPQQHEVMMQLMLGRWCAHSQFKEMKEAITLMRSHDMEIRPSEELPSVLSLIIQQCKADPSSIPECVALANSLWCDMVTKSVIPPLAVFHSMLRIYVFGADPDAAEGVITFLKQNDIPVTEIMTERLEEAHKARELLLKKAEEASGTE